MASSAWSTHFRLEPNEITDHLQRKGVQFRATDDQVVVKVCPFCHPVNNDPSNMYKLSFARDTGLFQCFRCNNTGNWITFLRRSSGAAIVEQDSEKEKVIDPDAGNTVAAAQEDLKSHAAVREYLTETRGLSMDTLTAYRVGRTVHRFPNDVDGKVEWQESECMVFPWIGRDNNEEVTLRMKVRSVSHKGNQRLLPAGGNWGFFGWHLVGDADKEIVVTEGEFDAMAVYQATKRPAVSLPNGARSLPVSLLPLLERFEKIYLWMDDDHSGRDGGEKIARKLGIGRTFLVRTRDGKPDGPKDANDALRAKCDLEELIQKSKRATHEQILTFSDMRDQVLVEIKNPEQVRGMLSHSLPRLNKILKGHRNGELTVFTGPTGAGKTSIVTQLSLDYCSRGMATLWGSFEIPNVRLARNMLKQFSAGNYEDFEYWADKFEEMPMYFMKFFGSTDLDKVIDAMAYAVYVHDVEHVIIDNLQFMTSGQKRGYEKFDLLDHAIETLRSFASTKNVHVTLVIHPRKEKEGEALSTSSVFGSAKATQEADNVVILQHKYYGSDYRYLDIRKNRFDGELGTIPFSYDKNTGKIYELAPAIVAQVRQEAEQTNAARQLVPFPSR